MTRYIVSDSVTLTSTACSTLREARRVAQRLLADHGEHYGEAGPTIFPIELYLHNIEVNHDLTPTIGLPCEGDVIEMTSAGEVTGRYIG